MAEYDIETTQLDDMSGSDDQKTDGVEVGQADTVEGAEGDATDQLVDRDGHGPEDPDSPEYKYWQASFTHMRRHDREQQRALQAEHQQYKGVLSNFYTDDAYALQVMRQRFPGYQIVPPTGTPGAAQNQPRGGQQPISPTVQLLEESLGSDLAFLAPRLGPVLEQVIQAGIKAGLAPIEHQTQQQQAAARRRTEDELMADMDRKHPGWERYRPEIQALEAWVTSDELSHPKFGNKYELYHRMVNPDMARIAAAKSMDTAGRNRLTTGRTGPQSQPDTLERVMKARTTSEAFMEAARAAQREQERSA